MTLVSTMPVSEAQNVTKINDNREEKPVHPDELTIRVKNHIAAPETSGNSSVKIDNGQSLAELFEETLKEKGEFPLTKANWSGPQELEVEGLSNMTLHSFILKAEAIGKKVSYSRNLTIKIED